MALLNPENPIRIYSPAGTALGPFSTYGGGGFTCVEPADVRVIVRRDGFDDAELTLTADYTLSGATPDANGYNVTLTQMPLGLTSWPAGAALLLMRRTATSQPNAVTPTLSVSQVSLKKSLDRLTRIVQEQDEQLGRAVLTPEGEAGLRLAPAADRRDRIAGFADTDGAELVPLTRTFSEFDADVAAVAAQATEILSLLDTVMQFRTVAVAAATHISARFRRIKTQFYAPTWAVPASLTGGAYYRRAALSELTDYPALSYFRSVDRYMPDGTEHATQGGYWVYDESLIRPKAFGAWAIGDTHNDADAVQAAFDLGKVTSRTVHFEAGTYYRPNIYSWYVEGHVSITGEGKHVSRLMLGDSVGGDRHDMITSRPGYTVHSFQMRDVGLISDWGTGDWTQRSHLMQVETLGDVSITNCHFENGRYMACVLINARSVLFADNTLEKMCSDGLHTTECRNITVTGNRFRFVNDDSVGCHTADHEPAPIEGNIVVTGNEIIDSQGIVILGAKKATISNNVITRPHVRGIFVGTDGGGVEGNTTPLAIDISDNVITDIFTGTVFYAPSGGQAEYIVVYGMPLTPAGGSYYVGQPDGGGGIVPPWPYFYTNNTDAGVVAGSWGINIKGNICRRTLAPTANYTDYGFGLRYGRGGPVNPTITDTDMGADYGQLMLRGTFYGLQIADNEFWGGFAHAIVLQGTAAATYLSFKDVVIRDNLIGNFGLIGIRATGKGVMEITNNSFDGDPLHTNALRLANGKWQPGNAHAAILYNAAKLIISGNTFRNLQSVMSGADYGDHQWLNNVMMYNPVVSDGYNANNIGIGQPPHPGVIHARVIITDDDPASATWGEVLNHCRESAAAMPTTGKYIQGQRVRNYYPLLQGIAPNQYFVSDWLRVTTGTGHVLGTDWYEMKVAA